MDSSATERPAVLAHEPDAAAGEVIRGNPAFNLLRYFSLASLIAIVVATAVLTPLYERFAARDLIEAQEQHHIALTRIAANTLWPNFSGFVRSSAALDNDALKSHSAIARLHQAVVEELAGTRVLKIKIYDLGGRTVFSTEAKQIGEDKSKNAGFLSARSGKPATELTHRNQFSAFEQTVENIDVVSSYVPIYVKDSKRVEGVFEIYSDISSLLNRIHETRQAVVLRVSAVLLVLYGALFLIVKHANTVIKQQDARQREDENKLREVRNQVVRSEEFHRSLVEHSSDAVLILNADLKVRQATVPLQRVTGEAETNVIGKPLVDCVAESERETITRWLTEVTSRPETAHTIEFTHNDKTGDIRYLEAVATNKLDHLAIRGIVVNIRDVTERKLAEIQVRRLALYDSLTGLAKRDFYAEQVRKAISQAHRYQEPLAVLFLDLDEFKRVNDTLGHDAGDVLLKEVATRLREILRESDTVGRQVLQKAEDNIARLGGDEFTILLTRLKRPEDAGAVARRILAAIGRPYRLNGRELTVTVSIGIAVFPQDGRGMEDLLRCADAAMYRSKEQGKNTFRFYSETPG